ncbi:MAG: hypothetical protein GWN58_42785 [Anaerolineae bacterium]|nr:hypothetical protein [Anaerolineae bacterium]
MRARRIRQVSLSLYRAMVYLSTGKQININEAKDMMKIVGLGFGKTDSAFRLGMQGVKDKLIAIIRSMQAGYPRSVVDTFHQRGGYTFEDLQKFGYNKADKGKNLIPWGYKLKREGQEVSFRDLPVDPNWRQEMSARRGAATDPRKRRSTTPAPQTQEDRDLINEMRGIQKEINRLKALEGEK